MNDLLLFQQFALLDALLSNWDGIRVRMGVLSVSLESEFTRIANEFTVAQSTDEVAILIDKLLDLTEETAAYDYVRELVARSSVPVTVVTRGKAAALEFAATDFPESTIDASRHAGHAVGAEVEFYPVPVFFATNRKVQPATSIEDCYSGEHAEELVYGYVEVTIPVQPHHKKGKLEHPLLGKEDKQRHVVLDKADGIEEADFVPRLTQALQGKQCKELLIFLHGYNVTFEEAARRAAQIAWDINFTGAVVLFSWPSEGAFYCYGADEERAAAAAKPLTTFLRALEGGPWNKVHIVAHSMGNRVLVSALARSSSLTLPVNNIVLVAADVYIDIFTQQFPELVQAVWHDKGGLITSYASKRDRALLVSWFFHQAKRVGHFRNGEQPFTIEGLQTIDATSVESSLLNLRHSYFGTSLLTDIGCLVSKGLPASRRGLRSAKTWWAFKQ